MGCMSDMQAFVRLTHQLKGASANVSAPILHAILKRIEEAGRVEQLEKISAGLADAISRMRAASSLCWPVMSGGIGVADARSAATSRSRSIWTAAVRPKSSRRSLASGSTDGVR